jgi:transposase
VRAFLGWLRGEARHCQMAAIPTLAQEDAKRPSRRAANMKVWSPSAPGSPTG